VCTVQGYRLCGCGCSGLASHTLIRCLVRACGESVRADPFCFVLLRVGAAGVAQQGPISHAAVLVVGGCQSWVQCVMREHWSQTLLLDKAWTGRTDSEQGVQAISWFVCMCAWMGRAEGGGCTTRRVSRGLAGPHFVARCFCLSLPDRWQLIGMAEWWLA